jgi:transposase-like protein
LSETRKHRKFTPQQKLELVMASWHDKHSIAERCREHDMGVDPVPVLTGSDCSL